MLETVVPLESCGPRRHGVKRCHDNKSAPVAGRVRNEQNPMNRYQRRAAKAAARSAKIDGVVAVHEAGHAVARYLTAADLGVSTNDAISYIEVAPNAAVTKSVDKRMIFRTQATTFGPLARPRRAPRWRPLPLTLGADKHSDWLGPAMCQCRQASSHQDPTNCETLRLPHGPCGRGAAAWGAGGRVPARPIT
jgi:hypothetical protein